MSFLPNAILTATELNDAIDAASASAAAASAAAASATTAATSASTLATSASASATSASAAAASASASAAAALAAAQVLPQVSKSADYTLTLAEKASHIFHPAADATPRTWTIPSNASVPFDVGTVLTFVAENGSGSITIAIDTDTLVLMPDGTTGPRTLAAPGMASAIKVKSNKWLISGPGLS